MKMVGKVHSPVRRSEVCLALISFFSTTSNIAANTSNSMSSVKGRPVRLWFQRTQCDTENQMRVRDAVQSSNQEEAGGAGLAGGGPALSA